jgi:hypothetical protein
VGLDLLIDVKKYNKSVKSAEKKKKKLFPKKTVNIMSYDPFELDESLWEDDLVKGIQSNIKFLTNIDFKGATRTLYDAKLVHGQAKITVDPIIQEENIGVDTAKRLLKFELTKKHVDLFKANLHGKLVGFKNPKTNKDMDGRLIFKLIRKLLFRDRIPSKCTCCGENAIVVFPRFKRNLEHELLGTSRESIPLAVWIHPSNILLYCPNCDGMRKHVNTKDSWRIERRKNWLKAEVNQPSLGQITGIENYSDEMMNGIEVVIESYFADSYINIPKWKDIKEFTK